MYAIRSYYAAVALAGMAGDTAGWTIIALLTAFSLARGVASIAAKDTMGKTISKGRRGRVSGHAATVSGIAAAAVGLYLAFSPAATRPGWLLYAMIAAAGVSRITSYNVCYTKLLRRVAAGLKAR